MLVAHGGIEMGQGLHVKMTQIAARALGIPLNQVNSSPFIAKFQTVYQVYIKILQQFLKNIWYQAKL